MAASRAPEGAGLERPDPFFQIITPVHNTGRFVAEAVRSVQAQSLPDWEMTIIDDGSTDDSVAHVEPFLEDPRITLIRQENQGVAAARNRALRESRARWLVMLDSDDLLMPGFLRRISDLIVVNPAVSLISADARLISEEGMDLGRPYSEMSAVPNGGFGVHLRELLKHNIFLPMSAVRRDAVMAVGGADTDLSSCIDYDLWLRIAAEGHLSMIVPERLASYRLRAGSITRDAGGHGGHVYEMRARVMQKMLNRSDLSLGHRSVAEQSLRQADAGAALASARSALSRGDYRGSRRHAWSAFRRAPEARRGLIAAGIAVAPEVVRRMHERSAQAA